MFEQTFVDKDNLRAYYLGARFTEDEKDLIKKSAKERKLSVSDLFRIALEKELKNKVREAKGVEN